MSITTKTGDDGNTSLWDGRRIPKDALRLECSGTIDELNCFLGDASHYIQSDEVKALIEILQRTLGTIAGSIVTEQEYTYPGSITTETVEQLTEWISAFEMKVPITGFVIPGSTPGSAKLDICRCVCRRAERRVVSLSHQEKVENVLLQYLNRLSDLLYMMARSEEFATGTIRYT